MKVAVVKNPPGSTPSPGGSEGRTFFKGKTVSKAYQPGQRSVRGLLLKTVLVILALCLGGMLFSLGMNNRSFREMVLPRSLLPCTDPLTGVIVECDKEIQLPADEPWIEEGGPHAKLGDTAAVESAAAAEAAAATATPAAAAAAAATPDDGLSELERSYKPNKAMVQRIAQDGYLVVTWANWHYQDFVRTWVARVKESGVTGYIVGAMDDRLMQALIDQQVNTFSMRSGLTENDFGWGTPTFAKMGREKIRLIRVFLDLDVTVVISDVDVLWLRNPIPYFQSYPTADILTSSDHLRNTVDDYQLELWPQAASSANIGIMMFRSKSLELVKEWIDVIEKDDKVWDQNAFNDLFRRGLSMIPEEPQHLFNGYHGQLKMGILPVSAFASGHTFFTQRMHQTLKLQPYALHATFQFSGTPGKRHRMREFMLFDDPPEYFDHPVGFMSYNVENLDELMKYAGPATGRMSLDNVQGHFALVNFQLTRLRNAFAISSMLGRALIIPQMYCGLDRWWAPHAGRIPGSQFTLPFPCPLDHVLELESGMSRFMDPNQFGKSTEFREHSLLQNRRMSDRVRSSKVVVEVCPPGHPECSDGNSPAPLVDGRVKIQAGLLSEQLRTALKATEGAKILDFSTMAGAFKNHTDPADWVRFANRIKGYTSLWCCVAAHPGHVHYDMLWDVPHHSDKFGRVWERWEAKTGP